MFFVFAFPRNRGGGTHKHTQKHTSKQDFFFQKSRLIREYGTRLSEERDFRVGEGNGLCLEKKGFERVFPENGELMFKSPEAMENRQILQPGRFRSQMRMTVRRT